MYFPRRAYDGFVVEAGLLYRMVEGSEREGIDLDEHRHDTQFVALRGLVGWSWTFGAHAFATLQVGASVGYQRGTETACNEACSDDRMPRVTRIGEQSVQPEIFMRIGTRLGP